MATENTSLFEHLRLGEMYEKGLDVEVNYKRAIELYASCCDYKDSGEGLKRAIDLCKRCVKDPELQDSLELKLALFERAERYSTNSPLQTIKAATRREKSFLQTIKAATRREKSFTKEDFKSYWWGKFWKELAMYYDCNACEEYSCNCIGYLSSPIDEKTGERRWNKNRFNIKWKGRVHADMFSICVFYTALVPQCIGKLYGQEHMINFFQAFGWPMFLCGMGGIPHPIQAVWKSGLFYLGGNPQDFETYIDRLKLAVDYLIPELTFNVGDPSMNESAYTRLQKVVNADELHQMIREQVSLYIDWIKDPRMCPFSDDDSEDNDSNMLSFKVGGADFDMAFVESNYPGMSNFHIGRTPVTQLQWKSVMDFNRSDHEGDTLPVECVTWLESLKFMVKLSLITGRTFWLPTKNQWMFAAHGGKYSKEYRFSGSNNLEDIAWYDGNSNEETHPVAQKYPNELGLYDMNGNVDEWCYDLSHVSNWHYDRLNKDIQEWYRTKCGGSCEDSIYEDLGSYCDEEEETMTIGATVGLRIVLLSDRFISVDYKQIMTDLNGIGNYNEKIEIFSKEDFEKRCNFTIEDFFLAYKNMRHNIYIYRLPLAFDYDLVLLLLKLTEGDKEQRQRLSDILQDWLAEDYF